MCHFVKHDSLIAVHLLLVSITSCQTLRNVQ